MPHAAIVNRLIWMQDRVPRSTESDVVLQKTRSTFDVSVWEFFWPLQIGARLVIAKPDGHRDPGYLAELIVAEQRVTIAHFVPSMLAVFVDGAECGAVTSRCERSSPPVRRCPPRSAHRLRALTAVRVHNLYGPTEAAVDVTYHRVVDAGRPIPCRSAAPVWNTRVYVLDARLRPAPAGCRGRALPGRRPAGPRLCGRGRISPPTASSPIRSPVEPTGDADVPHRRPGACGTPTANCEYLGRTDFQVKLRGQRIELGEIEAALDGLDEVSQSVVVVRGDQHTGDHLVAYVVAEPGLDGGSRGGARGARAPVARLHGADRGHGPGRVAAQRRPANSIGEPCPHRVSRPRYSARRPHRSRRSSPPSSPRFSVSSASASTTTSSPSAATR